jgi:hypothetical protein
VTPPLDPLVIKRLAFIRFLHAQGVEHSYRAEPLAATALLNFHDAVEHFLLLAAEYLNAGTSEKTTFDGYWGEINAKLPSGSELPTRDALRRMNKLRVILKHNGSFPSATDLQQARGDVATFLLDATRLVFDLDYSTLNLIDLVPQAPTIARLRQAEAEASKQDYVEALAVLGEAFTELLDDYAARKRGHGDGPYDFGSRQLMPHHAPTLHGASRLARQNGDTAELVAAVIDNGKALDTARQVIGTIQASLRVLAVGLDYRRYSRFSMLVPEVHIMMDRSRNVRPAVGLVLGNEEYEFCRDFVIEAALHLASVDFDLDLGALWRTAQTAAPAPGS